MIKRIRNFFLSLSSWFYSLSMRLRIRDISVGAGLKVYGKLDVMMSKKAHVRIGMHVVFKSATLYNFVGINKRCSIAVRDGATLSIGDNSGFSGTSIYVAEKVIIGKYCTFGGNTFVWDTDFHPLDHEARRIHDRNKIMTSPIIIGDDVFVGANSMILKGVTIGDRAIIGAGSVVTKNIPPGEVWAGNPAKCIRKC